MADWFNYDIISIPSECVGDLCRLRLNFVVLLITFFINSLSFDAAVPTIHQYVTNPTKIAMNRSMKLTGTNNGDEKYSGFGEEESIYSLAVTAFYFASVIVSPVVGYLTHCVPYFFILLGGTFFLALSNLLYGFANHSWMIILSRFILGISYQVFNVVTIVYFGTKESDYIQAYEEYKIRTEATKCGENKILRGDDQPAKMEIKKTLMIGLSISTFLPALVGPGISSLLAQIPSINLFRWIGHFNALLSVIVLVLVLTLFRGEYKLKRTKTRASCSKPRGAPLNYTRIIVLVFLVFCFCVWKTGLGILYTIFNPILSDSFGLTVKETSYYFTALMVMYVMGPFLLLIVNIFELFHPRLMFIGVYIMLIIGSSLIADWQTLGEDSCRMFSYYHHHAVDSNTSMLCKQASFQNSYCSGVQLAANTSNWTSAGELCQGTDGCHWNQFSVISNAFCISCPAICRSVHQSLSIIQFSVGAALFVLALPIADICYLVLLSNNLQDHEQGPVNGIAIAVSGIIGTLNPLWVDALYEKFHKRTAVPMSLYIVLCVSVFIGLLILYRVLDPGELKGKQKMNGVIAEDEEKFELLSETSIE